jgi:hypothetical protein
MNTYGWERQKERDHQEDLHIGGKIILQWISERWGCMEWIDGLG